MDSDAASDVSMHTAPSRTPSPSPLPSLVSKDDVNFSNFVQIPMVLDEPEEKPVVSEASADLLSRLPGVYRLLDLVQDQSSGGVVDKIIIAQKSIAAFANTIHPGSYRSDIQVFYYSRRSIVCWISVVLRNAESSAIGDRQPAAIASGERVGFAPQPIALEVLI